MNRSPIQLPTLVWAGFFVSPYFVTKIVENRHHVPLRTIIVGLRYTLLSSVLLGAGAAYLTRNDTSPPLIVLGAALPFIAAMVVTSIRRRRTRQAREGEVI